MTDALTQKNIFTTNYQIQSAHDGGAYPYRHMRNPTMKHTQTHTHTHISAQSDCSVRFDYVSDEKLNTQSVGSRLADIYRHTIPLFITIFTPQQQRAVRRHTRGNGKWHNGTLYLTHLGILTEILDK